MNKFELSAKDMRVIMMALYNSEENAEDASELHDNLVTEGFDRFEDRADAILSWKGV